MLAAGLDSHLDARGHGQRSGITYLVSAKELLLGHEAVLCLQFLGGRFIFHGRRRVDRGHWGWGWDRGHRWSGHEGWKDRNRQLCEWGESPGIRAGETLEGRLQRFPVSPSERCEGPLLAESGSQPASWPGDRGRCPDWAAGHWKRGRTDGWRGCLPAVITVRPLRL